MADATAVIRELGNQLAQQIVDRTIAQVELVETRAELETMRAQAQSNDPGEGQSSQGPAA